MSFLKLEDKDVISFVYTVYPTRSIVMNGVGAGTTGYSYDEFKDTLEIYDSGSMPGVGFRNFYDISAGVLSQSFYTKATISLKFNHVLTASEKTVAKRLLSTYASSSFYKPQNYTSSSITSGTTAHILSIPAVLVGSGIKPGSFSLESSGVGSSKLEDDGYGGIYTGSLLVGSIFYEYGLAFFGASTNYSTFAGVSSVSLTCNFSATNNIPMNVYLCKMPKSMLNFSNNPSYTVLSGTKNEITSTYPKVFVTGIGLYDEDFELVGVAKVANPIQVEEKEGPEFRLKLNF